MFKKGDVKRAVELAYSIRANASALLQKVSQPAVRKSLEEIIKSSRRLEKRAIEKRPELFQERLLKPSLRLIQQASQNLDSQMERSRFFLKMSRLQIDNAAFDRAFESLTEVMSSVRNAKAMTLASKRWFPPSISASRLKNLRSMENEAKDLFFLIGPKSVEADSISLDRILSEITKTSQALTSGQTGFSLLRNAGELAERAKSLSSKIILSPWASDLQREQAKRAKILSGIVGSIAKGAEEKGLLPSLFIPPPEATPLRFLPEEEKEKLLREALKSAFQQKLIDFLSKRVSEGEEATIPAELVRTVRLMEREQRKKEGEDPDPLSL